MKTKTRHNILIVEDEKNALQFLKKLLLRYFEKICNEIYLASTIEEASSILLQEKVDVLFLDIQLGDENGFDLIRKFSSNDFKVVFTTAHKEYAIKAIKSFAFDYLLKPINKIDLMDVFRKIEQREAQDRISNEVQELKDGMVITTSNEYNKLALPTEEGFDLFSFGSIYYLEASGSYSKIIINGSTVKISGKPLKYFDEKLPDKLFFRCHKSFVVNLNHVVRYDKKNRVAVLSSGVEIPIASRKKESFIHEIARL